MLIIIIFLCISIAIGILYYIIVYRRKILIKRMALGIDQVKLGLFSRLERKFEADHGREKAGLIAAAITNKLFYENASNQEGQEFSEANEDSIWREIAILMEDEATRYIISQAIRVKATLFYAHSSQVDYEFLHHVEKLNEIGWKMPSMAPSPHNFIPEAQDFFDSIPK